MKYNKALNSFSSGELGDDLRARFDIPQYKQGVATMSNFLPKGSGGAERRLGTQVKAELVANGPDAEAVALIPYKYRDETLFIGIALKGTLSASVKWYKYSDIDPNVLEPNDYSADSTTTGYTKEYADDFQYTQIGKYLVVVDTNGTEPPVVYDYVQEFSGVELLGYNMVRHAWADFTEAKPTGFGWLSANTIPTVTMTPTTIVGSADGVLIDAISRLSTSVVACSQPYFTEDHVGHFIRITQLISTTYIEGVARIISITDSTHVMVEEWVAFGDTSPSVTGDWALSAFSPYPDSTDISYTGTPYPRCVGSFQDRLIFGGCEKSPNTLFISELGNIKNFMDLKLYKDRTEDTDFSGLGYFGAIQATDAFSLSLTGTDGLAITFASGNNVLFVGTNQRPFIIRSTGEGFGPTTAEAISQKAISCGRVQPVSTSAGVAFVSEDRQQVHLGRYVENTGEYIDRNVTLLNSDIVSHGRNTAYTKFYDFTGIDKYVRSGFRQLVWDKDNTRLWVLNDRGHMGCLTLEESAKTEAWATHYLADGYKDFEITFPERGAFISWAIKAYTGLHLITRRIGDVLNTTASFVEVIEDDSLLASSSVSGATVLLDMSIIDYTTEPQAGVAFELPSYLWGYNSVDYIRFSKDAGETEPALAVGSLTLEADGKSVIVPISGRHIFGFAYDSVIETMPLETGDTSKASRGDSTRIDRATIMFYRAKFANIYTAYNSQIAFDTRDDIELHNIDITVEVPHSPDREGIVGIKVDLPLPCTVLGLVLRGVSNE